MKDAAQLRADYIPQNYTKFEYRIPARDGKLLFYFSVCTE